MANDGFTVNDFEHLEAQSDVAYGIYDTQDNCWIGDDIEPKLFTREDSAKMKGLPQNIMAQIAAQMAGVQLGYAPGRLRAVEFNAGDLKLKDSVPTKMSAVEALRRLENGKL